LGQGTVAVEIEKQVRELVEKDAGLSVHTGDGKGAKGTPGVLDAVVTPLGGAGLTSGVASYYSTRTPKTFIFGAE
ncbi:hypothetical protein EMCG_00107, partial [[Emmonsia] crescens]